jgi:hypothetical protein
MNQLKTSATDDSDDNIGALIYQHAKREAAAAAASHVSAAPYRQSAHIRSKRACVQAKSTSTTAKSVKSKGDKNSRLHKLASWKTRYNELLEFKRKFGDCCVPTEYKANLQLGSWVRNQRRYFKCKSLSTDRIALLNQIGFTWEINREDDWIKRYGELVEHKRELGHCNVLAKYKANPSLAEWVYSQRKLFKSKSLSRERIAKLNQIGFTWKRSKEDIWIERYNELVEYKRKFGDCNVPQRHQANPSLAQWVHMQRKVFKSKSLSRERIAKLNQIGFTWEINKANNWVKRYNELVEYKHKFGDCCVNSRYKANTSLANWVHTQRKLFKSISLSRERIEKLNQIGFDWEHIRKIK